VVLHDHLRTGEPKSRQPLRKPQFYFVSQHEQSPLVLRTYVCIVFLLCIVFHFPTSLASWLLHCFTPLWCRVNIMHLPQLSFWISAAEGSIFLQACTASVCDSFWTLLAEDSRSVGKCTVSHPDPSCFFCTSSSHVVVFTAFSFLPQPLHDVSREHLAGTLTDFSLRGDDLPHRVDA
jgi:hypothetical protein